MSQRRKGSYGESFDSKRFLAGLFGKYRTNMKVFLDARNLSNMDSSTLQILQLLTECVPLRQLEEDVHVAHLLFELLASMKTDRFSEVCSLGTGKGHGTCDVFVCFSGSLFLYKKGRFSTAPNQIKQTLYHE